MSDQIQEFTRCVRGCTMRCKSFDCKEAGAHDHEPIPRQSEVGLLCAICARRILEALADIELMYPELSIYAQQQGQQQEGKRGKLSGSPALIRLDVLAMLDFNANPGDGVRSIMGTLASWADCVRDDLGLVTSGSPIDILRTWHARICALPWIDDYWDEVTELAGMLRRATNQPKPIGRCFGRATNKGCGRRLYEPVPPETAIVCPDENCGRRYDGAELVKLQIQGERDRVGSRIA